MARKGQKADLQFFEGRVQHWELKWVPAVKGIKNDEVRLELMKWVPTGEVTPDPVGPRHPHLVPVKDPRNKPLMSHGDPTNPHQDDPMHQDPNMHAYPDPNNPHGGPMGQHPHVPYLDPHYMGPHQGQPGYPMQPGMGPSGYPMQPMQPMQPGMPGGMHPQGFVPGGQHGYVPGGPPPGTYMGMSHPGYM